MARSGCRFGRMGPPTAPRAGLLLSGFPVQIATTKPGQRLLSGSVSLSLPVLFTVLSSELQQGLEYSINGQ